MTRSSPARQGVTLLLALMVVGACGSGAADVVDGEIADAAPSASTAGPDELGRALEGAWRVQAASTAVDTVLDLHGGEFRVANDCVSFTGAWTARSGLFLAEPQDGWSHRRDCPDTDTPTHPAWLVDAAGYARSGGGWVLLDRSARTVATLLPGAEEPGDRGSISLELENRARPTPEERAAANTNPAAPLPAGLTPAAPSDIPGRWAPAGAANAGCGPWDVTFYANGRWDRPEDEFAGRWVVGDDGLALATDSATPRMACVQGEDDVAVSPVDNLHAWMPRVARLGLDGTGLDGKVLVLLDRTGRELGRLERLPDPTPEPPPEPEDPRRKGNPVTGGGVRYLADTDEHQFDIAPYDRSSDYEDSWDGDQIFGVDHTGRAMKIITGCSTGDVWLTVRARTEAPPPLARSMKGWEVGEEETLTVRGPLYASSLSGGWGEKIFTPKEPGLHRVRVLAKGRNINYDLVCEEPVESYDVTIWPVDTREPRVRVGADGT